MQLRHFGGSAIFYMPGLVDIMDKIKHHQFAEKLDLAGYSVRTAESYCYGLQEFSRYLDTRETGVTLDTVEQKHLTSYMAYLRYDTSERHRFLSPSTQRMWLNSLKLFYRLMYDEADPRRDYEHVITGPKCRQQLPKNVPSEKQMQTLLDSIELVTPIDLRNRAMLELLYATALRSMELLGLTNDNLNLTNNTLFVHGKGAKDRIVPVGSWVVPWLVEYLTVARPKLVDKRMPTDLLFVSKSGRVIPHSNLCYIIHKYSVAASLPFIPSPHAFRHACATHLLTHGADIRYIQELLGHASLSTTQIYTRVDITQLKKMHGKYHPREQAYCV